MPGEGEKKTYTWTNGTIYHGQWMANVIHGDGKLEWANKTEYTGEFVDH